MVDKLKLCVASANLQHWIKIGGIMIDGEARKENDYRSKMAWAQQLFSSTQPQIIGLQEIYDEESLREIFAHPGFAGKDYQVHLSGGPPQQVAIATTLPLAEPVQAIHQLSEPLTIEREALRLTVSRLSRPILKARLRHEDNVVTVFVVHLKSKLPSFTDDVTVQPPEELLLECDLAQRCIGSLVSLVRRGAEAAVLRREVVRELENTDNPVIVLGDFNDDDGAVTTEMVLGDPVSAFIPPRKGGPAYTNEEKARIRARLFRTALTSAQAVHLKNTSIAQLYTNIHGGRYGVLDEIHLSRHFFRTPRGVDPKEFEQRYYFNYFDVANDHLVDKDCEFAPRKPMTSDHGPVFAYLNKIKPQPPVGVHPDGEPEPHEFTMVPQSPADLEIR